MGAQRCQLSNRRSAVVPTFAVLGDVGPYGRAVKGLRLSLRDLIDLVRGDPDPGYPFVLAALLLALTILTYVAIVGATSGQSAGSSFERQVTDESGRVVRLEPVGTPRRSPLILFSMPAIVTGIPAALNRTRWRRLGRATSAGLLGLMVLAAPFTLFLYVPVIGLLAVSAILDPGR